MSIVLKDDLSAAHEDATAHTVVVPRPIPPLLVSELLRIYDLAAIGCSALMIYGLYVTQDSDPVRARYFGSVALATVIFGFIGQWFGSYGIDRVFERWLGLRRALTSWLIAFGVCLTIVFTLKITDFYSRVWAVSWFALSIALLAAGRYLLHSATHRWAMQGRFANRSLVVGTGEQALRLTSLLRARGDPRTHIIGFIDVGGPASPGERLVDKVIGDGDTMMSLIRRSLVDEVIIALPWSEEQRVGDLAFRLSTTPVRVRLAPDLIGFHFVDHAFTSRSGLPLLKVLDRPMTGWSFVAKTIEDYTIAAVSLILVAPVMLAVAAAIKLDSPGSVLFKQRRYGFNDKLIEVWKFRTMRVDCTDHDCDRQTTRDDPRVTRVGRFLRMTSLDELPQLFNVLRGEMSIVGPRPHAVATKAEGSLFHEVVDGYAARHRVKPGITGWAQVNGWRGETDTIHKIRRRVEYDLYYIDNWSVWLDLRILARTAFAVLPTDNTY